MTKKIIGIKDTMKICAVFISIFSLANANADCPVLRHTEYIGEKVGNELLAATSIAACIRACYANVKCAYWTWASREIPYPFTSKCFLWESIMAIKVGAAHFFSAPLNCTNTTDYGVHHYAPKPTVKSENGTTGTTINQMTFLASPGNYTEFIKIFGGNLEKAIKDALVTALQVNASRVQNVACTKEEPTVNIKFDLHTTTSGTIMEKMKGLKNIIVIEEKVTLGENGTLEKNVTLGENVTLVEHVIPVNGIVMLSKIDLGQAKNTATTSSNVATIAGSVVGVAGFLGAGAFAIWWYKYKVRPVVEPDQ